MRQFPGGEGFQSDVKFVGDDNLIRLDKGIADHGDVTTRGGAFGAEWFVVDKTQAVGLRDRPEIAVVRQPHFRIGFPKDTPVGDELPRACSSLHSTSKMRANTRKPRTMTVRFSKREKMRCTPVSPRARRATALRRLSSSRSAPHGARAVAPPTRPPLSAPVGGSRGLPLPGLTVQAVADAGRPGAGAPGDQRPQPGLGPEPGPTFLPSAPPQPPRQLES